MKRIVDCKTEVRNGELFQRKIYDDGSVDERRIDDAQMSKLMRAIMDQKYEVANTPSHLRLIKGGKQAGSGEILAVIACALIFGAIMTIGATQEEDDHCTRAGWAKHADCYGEPVFP